MLPAHPHEGAVSVPKGANARAIAAGHSASPDAASTWQSPSTRTAEAAAPLPTPASITFWITTSIQLAVAQALSPKPPATGC